jgi:hypothetical protein
VIFSKFRGDGCVLATHFSSQRASSLLLAALSTPGRTPSPRHARSPRAPSSPRPLSPPRVAPLTRRASRLHSRRGRRQRYLHDDKAHVRRLTDPDLVYSWNTTEVRAPPPPSRMRVALFSLARCLALDLCLSRGLALSQ